MNVCYGCASTSTNTSPGMAGVTDEPLFTDSRTGRAFCGECVVALVTWEMDGQPDPGDHPYPEWIDATVEPEEDRHGR